MRSLANIIEDMDNPFPPPEDCSDLLTLDSRDITESAVIDTLLQLEKLGEEEYDA